MKSVQAIIDRMIQAANARNMAEMLRICALGKSSGSTWKKRGSIPEGSLARVANKTGCNLEWLRTGQGEMFIKNAPPTLHEDLDIARDDYQPHADGAPLFEEVTMRLEQVEEILLSDFKEARLLNLEIKKYYKIVSHKRRQRRVDEQLKTGSDNHGR